MNKIMKSKRSAVLLTTALTAMVELYRAAAAANQQATRQQGAAEPGTPAGPVNR